MCVLVVEDDKTLGEVLVRQLHRLGFKADLVTTGREAVERAHDNCYGLVLMDISLPDQDGLTTTKEIKQQKSDLSVVGITAGHSSREECLKAGMADYYTKPVMNQQMKS